VFKDVVYVLKVMIMCWEKDVICALNSGICAQGNRYVLSIVAYVLKGVT
jgi:hypothetical protein